MTLRKLASEIAHREGKKSQARIGDIREILRIIVELDVESVEKLSSKGSVLFFGEPAQALHNASATLWAKRNGPKLSVVKPRRKK